ncbi:hypothetical protein EBB59_10930 [Lysobacter pythonis]|uniref:Zeta toxin domain-containing protein n=1 Tax=Solilutibacter pythonis TaxID=2483112 RepID=A0A3M2HNF8_9GAMM|nr:zeta toxin family protein [Lysobacter pythonis]RMH89100.1 hypothetical protein EBB59_10930 [Lysobacter pythonis]
MSTPTDRLDPELHARVFEEQIVPKSLLSQKGSHEHPKAIILGGQPGAGKGGLARSAELELRDDIVKIDPDALREYHLTL